MTNKKNHLSLYLQKYAEADAQTISELFSARESFDYCLVIPAYNENIEFLQRLKESSLVKHALLLIVIINQPDTKTCTNENQALYLQTKQMGTLCTEQKYWHINKWGKTTLLTLDYFTDKRRLPAKQGVGLARKTGCDIACALIKKNVIKGTWIHTTDADTVLPDDYFSRTPLKKNYSAAVYPFQHRPTAPENQSINQATQLYEQSLNYYVAGLSYALSPYAYHTLGSCIAIDAETYAKVRGFPKRAGGEDFYLLNKLNKLGEIKQIAGQPLIIQARLSQRAPFGTGPAVSKIVEQGLTTETYPYYNPLTFKELKALLSQFDTLFNFKHQPEKWLEGLSPNTKAALIQLNIYTLFKHMSDHATDKKEALKQARDWFDAFKTLKFIHILEGEYTSIPLQQGMEQLSTLSKNT